MEFEFVPGNSRFAISEIENNVIEYQGSRVACRMLPPGCAQSCETILWLLY